MRNFNNSYNVFVFSLEQINEAAAKYPKEFVMSMEDKYKEEISSVVDSILSKEYDCKVVMLAGPSGSGKTTTAHMIKNELIRRGKESALISLDDFYKGNRDTPLTEDGKFDYESIDALDVSQIKEVIHSLINTGSCLVPKYNFSNKSPEKEKREINLSKDGIAIIEGIHALNPILTRNLPENKLLKIYISVKQGIVDYNGQVFERKDIRFIRRLIRDYNHRGTDAKETFEMWDNVCRGEFLYIDPFKRTSDITINSIHIYEPCILTHTGLSLLNSIEEDSPYFYFSRRILSGLQRFYPINPRIVPKTSLIREFIGGGIYD